MLRKRVEMLIEQMEIIKDKEIRSKQADLQNKIDEKFSNVVSMYAIFIQKYMDSKKIMDFNLSLESSELVKEIYNDLNSAVIKDKAQVEKVNSGNSNLGKLNDAVKSEWQQFYYAKTSEIKKTINIFKNVKSEEVNDILTMIGRCQVWDNCSNKNLNDLKNGLVRAKNFIEENSNEEIKDFLNKIYIGNAKLSDLNDEVYDWIKKENLADKIYIKF